jgi:ornithine cyclodeaminase/alanine dehydrogenase-like protein (mu-crystallin family)
MLALAQVRDFQRVLVYDRDRAALEAYVRDMPPLLERDVVGVDDAEAVFRDSQVMATWTPSRTPYVKPEWLHPGLHITAMGADLPEKQELEAGVFGRVDLLVCDRRSQSFAMGELHHGVEGGHIKDPEQVLELGQLTSGRAAGRRDDGQVTLCDLTGTGVQDTAIANVALDKALALGLGLTVDAP